MSKNIVSILAILVLTACGGGGGSDPIVESSYTPPPTPAPTYTPPDWDGIGFYETDPNSDQWIDATYRRLTQDEKDSVNFESNNYNFKRTNYGLLYHFNNGYVNPIEDDFEASQGGNEWGIDLDAQISVGDFNNDGLEDVFVGHRFAPNKAEWKAGAPGIILINQGNDRLEVDPCIFKDCEIPRATEMFITHVADFNMDGTDDIINIGADPLVLLSGNNGIEDKSHLFKDTLKEIKSGSHNDVGNVWTHTTAIGDLDNNGTIDIYIPFNIFDRSEECASTPAGCHNYTLLNDGYGNFTLGSANFPFTGAVWGSIIYDFDNDGYGDILVSLDDIQPDHIFYNSKHWGTSSSMIMFGNPDGNYTRDIVYLDESLLGEHFIGLEFFIDDLDSDGDMDIIATQTGEGENYYADNQIQIFENKGNREFVDISSTFVDRSREGELVKHPTHDLPAGMYQLVDLDGDGDMDLWPKAGQYYQPFYLREYNKFVLSSVSEVLDFLGTENNCDYGCANTFYTGLAVDIDNDGRKDFLQTNVDNGWNFSQLMTLYNAF